MDTGAIGKFQKDLALVKGLQFKDYQRCYLLDIEQERFISFVNNNNVLIYLSRDHSLDVCDVRIFTHQSERMSLC